MKNRIQYLLVALGLAGLATFAPLAVAQQGSLNYGKTGTNVVGQMAGVFNAIDSTIADGTIVSIDTTTAASSNLKRIVVRPYAGTALTRGKCIGVAVGPIRRSSQGGNGRILLWGYHPNAKINASGLAANTMLKVSPATHGAFMTCPDSLYYQVAWFLGYNSRSTAAVNRGKIFIIRPIGVPSVPIL